MTSEGVLLAFLVCLVCGVCIAFLIEPMREKFMRRKEYDVNDENPWEEMLGEKPQDKGKKNKRK